MESPNPGITGLFLFFIINYHLSCLIYSVCAYALASSCLPLSLINLIENSAICEMFLLHFIPSAIITDICQIYIQIKRITVLLQDFSHWWGGNNSLLRSPVLRRNTDNSNTQLPHLLYLCNPPLHLPPPQKAVPEYLRLE